MSVEYDNGVRSKSWFCVYNNPQKEYPDKTPEDIAELIADIWCDENHVTRTAAVASCISADGLFHLHMVLEDTKQMRFSAVKKVFSKAHLEPTKGSKEQAEDYINKRGKFSDKGEQVLYIARRGEIKGAQGQRRDLEVIGDCIEKGMTPSQIMELSFTFRRYAKMIREAYFDKRKKETPWYREVKVYWHVGESESGKTRVSSDLVEKYGEDEVYMIGDYEHGFDMYQGERILFIDEFRSQWRYSMLLSLLDGYKKQVGARYTNVVGLWTEVHITSVLPPEDVYKKLVDSDQGKDTLRQLLRRLTAVVYHWTEDGERKQYEQSGKEYSSYSFLKMQALSNKDGFVKVPDNEPSFGDI